MPALGGPRQVDLAVLSADKDIANNERFFGPGPQVLGKKPGMGHIHPGTAGSAGLRICDGGRTTPVDQRPDGGEPRRGGTAAGSSTSSAEPANAGPARGWGLQNSSYGSSTT